MHRGGIVRDGRSHSRAVDERVDASHFTLELVEGAIDRGDIGNIESLSDPVDAVRVTLEDRESHACAARGERTTDFPPDRPRSAEHDAGRCAAGHHSPPSMTTVSPDM
jgi:hypothetical protein